MRTFFIWSATAVADILEFPFILALTGVVLFAALFILAAALGIVTIALASILPIAALTVILAGAAWLLLKLVD